MARGGQRLMATLGWVALGLVLGALAIGIPVVLWLRSLGRAMGRR